MCRYRYFTVKKNVWGLITVKNPRMASTHASDKAIKGSHASDKAIKGPQWQ